MVVDTITRAHRNLILFAFILFVVCVAAGFYVLGTRTVTNAERGAVAVCAVIDYADRQADNIVEAVATGRIPEAERPQSLRYANDLRRLVADMRNTGVDCPPAKPTVD